MEEVQQTLLSGHWEAIIGMLLLVLAPAIEAILKGKLGSIADKWISLSRGVLLGVGAPLAASVAANVPWWVAVVTGLIGLVQSAGFQDQVRSLIPVKSTQPKPMGGQPGSAPPPIPLAIAIATVAFVAWILVTCSGCSVRQTQTNIRTGLTAAGDALLSADRVISPEAERASNAILADIAARCAEEHGAGEPCPGALAEYRQRYGYREDGPDVGWAAVAPAFRASYEALSAADAGIMIWVHTGHLPCCWDQVCHEGAEAVSHIVEAVEAGRGEPSPASLNSLPGSIEALCTLALPYLGDDCECQSSEEGDVQ